MAENLRTRPQPDDRKRLRKIHHQAKTGARREMTEAQAATLAAPQVPKRLFREDRITIGLFVFVFSCTILPLGLLILIG